MIKSASTLRGFNVDWSIGRRAAPDGGSDRYEYRPTSADHDLSTDEATLDVAQDPPAGRALRPAPPAWRACRADMPRKAFLCVVCGWAGAALVLLATVLLVRLSG